MELKCEVFWEEELQFSFVLAYNVTAAKGLK